MPPRKPFEIFNTTNGIQAFQREMGTFRLKRAGYFILDPVPIIEDMKGLDKKIGQDKAT